MRSVLVFLVMLVLSCSPRAVPELADPAGVHGDLSITRSSSAADAAIGVQINLRNESERAVCFPIHRVVGPLFDKSLLEVVGPDGPVLVPDDYAALLRETSAHGVIVLLPHQTYVSSVTVNDVYSMDSGVNYAISLRLPIYACGAMDHISSLSDNSRAWKIGEFTMLAETNPGLSRDGR